MKLACATGLVTLMSWLAMPAHAQQCSSYTSAALIGMVEVRCSSQMVTTSHGEKRYEALVRAGLVEAASCATPGARTAQALGDLGFMTADAMIDKLAGTSIQSPKNAQTLTKQCNALAKVLDSMSPSEPIYRKK